MAAIENETFWKEFIDLYKNLPELWQTTNERYKKKSLKDKAYRILLEKLREVQPYATESTLKRKLNILKESYRHELYKVRRSEKTAKNPDEVYVPALWFFNELSFLGDQDGMSDTGASDIEDNLLEVKPVTAKESLGTGRNKSKPAPYPSRKQDKQIEHSKILSKLHRSKTPVDDSQIFSATWAALFRKLKPQQQVHANKAIMDILYEGQLSSMDDFNIPKQGSSSELSINPSNERVTQNIFLNDYTWKH